MSRNTPLGFDRQLAIARNILVDFSILALAYLIATYFRQTLPIGKDVGENYEWFSPRIYAPIALSVAIAHLLLTVLVQAGRVQTQRGRLRTSLFSLGTPLVAISLFLPHQSGLQKVYF